MVSHTLEVPFNFAYETPLHVTAWCLTGHMVTSAWTFSRDFTFWTFLHFRNRLHWCRIEYVRVVWTRFVWMRLKENWIFKPKVWPRHYRWAKNDFIGQNLKTNQIIGFKKTLGLISLTVIQGSLLFQFFIIFSKSFKFIVKLQCCLNLFRSVFDKLTWTWLQFSVKNDHWFVYTSCY